MTATFLANAFLEHLGTDLTENTVPLLLFEGNCLVKAAVLVVCFAVAA